MMLVQSVFDFFLLKWNINILHARTVLCISISLFFKYRTYLPYTTFRLVLRNFDTENDILNLSITFSMWVLYSLSRKFQIFGTDAITILFCVCVLNHLF